VFERLLVPGSTEKPTCRCGDMMDVASIERLPEGSDGSCSGLSVCCVPSRDAAYRMGNCNLTIQFILRSKSLSIYATSVRPISSAPVSTAYFVPR
jgi:hypothetical protein